MSTKNKVVVKIHGKEYNIVGVESEEYIQRVGLYIDKKMHEITKSNQKLSTAMAAVLTSLNIADDYFKCRQMLEEQKKIIEQKEKELNYCMENNKQLKNEVAATKYKK